jgi:hypothetical protein
MVDAKKFQKCLVSFVLFISSLHLFFFLSFRTQCMEESSKNAWFQLYLFTFGYELFFIRLSTYCSEESSFKSKTTNEKGKADINSKTTASTKAKKARKQSTTNNAK